MDSVLAARTAGADSAGSREVVRRSTRARMLGSTMLLRGSRCKGGAGVGLQASCRTVAVG